ERAADGPGRDNVKARNGHADPAGRGDVDGARCHDPAYRTTRYPRMPADGSAPALPAPIEVGALGRAGSRFASSPSSISLLWLPLDTIRPRARGRLKYSTAFSWTYCVRFRLGAETGPPVSKEGEHH